MGRVVELCEYSFNCAIASLFEAFQPTCTAGEFGYCESQAGLASVETGQSVGSHGKNAVTSETVVL